MAFDIKPTPTLTNKDDVERLFEIMEESTDILDKIKVQKEEDSKKLKEIKQKL